MLGEKGLGGLGGGWRRSCAHGEFVLWRWAGMCQSEGVR